MCLVHHLPDAEEPLGEEVLQALTKVPLGAYLSLFDEAQII